MSKYISKSEADNIMQVLEKKQKSIAALAAFMGVNLRTLRQILRREKKASLPYLNHLFLSIGLKKIFVDVAFSDGESVSVREENQHAEACRFDTVQPMPRPPRYPRPSDGRLCGTAPEPEPPPVLPTDPNRFFELF